MVDHLLVGCKYIAEVIRQIEEDGRSGAIAARLEDFVIGTEESHGFLLTSDVRDKDAGGPALLLAELAAREKAREARSSATSRRSTSGTVSPTTPR